MRFMCATRAIRNSCIHFNGYTFIYYALFWAARKWKRKEEKKTKWAFLVQINIYLVEFISIHSISIMKTNATSLPPFVEYSSA